MQILSRVLILPGLVICSCRPTDQKQEETIAQKVAVQQPAEKNSYSDTLTIGSKSAVFFQPDSSTLEKRLKEPGEEEFRAGADDYIYYINQSADYLEKQGLPVIDAKDKKFIKFIFENQATHFVKLDTLPDLRGMFLFDTKQPPFYTDITEIEEDYKRYFK